MNHRDDDIPLKGMPVMSNHAEQRARQRGAHNRCIAIVAQYGDRELRQRDGRRRISLSCQRKIELIRGGMAVQEVERAACTELVEADDGTIVTVLKVKSRGARRISIRRGQVRYGGYGHGR